MIVAMYDRLWAPGRIWAICNLELHLACNLNAEMWGFMKLNQRRNVTVVVKFCPWFKSYFPLF